MVRLNLLAYILIALCFIVLWQRSSQGNLDCSRDSESTPQGHLLDLLWMTLCMFCKELHATLMTYPSPNVNPIVLDQYNATFHRKCLMQMEMLCIHVNSQVLGGTTRLVTNVAPVGSFLLLGRLTCIMGTHIAGLVLVLAFQQILLRYIALTLNNLDNSDI